jgi:hypothetical protein
MKKYEANIDCNGVFWKFVPIIDVGLCYTDSEKQINFDFNISLNAISEGLFAVLSHSRTISSSDPESANFPKRFAGYTDWLKGIMRKYGYKSEIAIYKNMQSCSAILKDASITISPSNHCSTKGWDGMDKKFATVIPCDSSPEVIGAAVKYSIARCTGKGADLVAKKLFSDGVPETFEDYLKSLDL